MPRVLIWRDGVIEVEFDPGHRDWRIGRSETNDITLVDPRKSVSRFHAELREEHGRWVFVDLNSQNGSWKGGQRITRLVLEPGHEVLFGDYTLAFQEAGPATRRTAQSAPAAGEIASQARGNADPEAAPATPATPDWPPPIPPATSAAAPRAVALPASGTPAAHTNRPLRRGVTVVIVVLVLIALLGAVAALVFSLLTEHGPVATTTPGWWPDARTGAAGQHSTASSGGAP